MHAVLKRIVIAAALIAVCAVVLALTKRYGVWVISVIAGGLVVAGLLRRDRQPGRAGDTPAETGSASGEEPDR
jgi:hypothetical protein